ncbi:MAG TPA: cytochrome P450 [Verrucomicrobiae bacterium]
MENNHLPASDPFHDQRKARGVLETFFQGKKVPMILGFKDVRAAAADWKAFSNDAPFRVPIPSEENVRSVRQLPIETDPPEHTEYRKIIEPFFRRPKEPEMAQKLEALVGELLKEAAARPSIEIVREFALPLQSRALTYLLRVPETEAKIWIGWGIHVFRDGTNGEEKGAVLEGYIEQQLDRAAQNPGDDFFSALTQAKYHGRPLTRPEMIGFANLTFAGGRDTVIQAVSSIIGYLGGHPEALEKLRAKPELLNSATEEFFRFISPLTHIGRVCPHATEVKGVKVEADQRVSLCWASANRDASVFENPEEVRLDRKPNPHVAFGSGVHSCLGALHARQLVRSLLHWLCERVATIEILDFEPHREREAHYERQVGYDSLTVRMVLRGAIL